MLSLDSLELGVSSVRFRIGPSFVCKCAFRIAFEKKRSIGSHVFVRDESQAVGMQRDFRLVAPSLSRHPQGNGLAAGSVQIAERSAELLCKVKVTPT